MEDKHNKKRRYKKRSREATRAASNKKLFYVHFVKNGINRVTTDYDLALELHEEGWEFVFGSNDLESGDIWKYYGVVDFTQDEIVNKSKKKRKNSSKRCGKKPSV